MAKLVSLKLPPKDDDYDGDDDVASPDLPKYGYGTEIRVEGDIVGKLNTDQARVEQAYKNEGFDAEKLKPWDSEAEAAERFDFDHLIQHRDPRSSSTAFQTAHTPNYPSSGRVAPVSIP